MGKQEILDCFGELWLDKGFNLLNNDTQFSYTLKGGLKTIILSVSEYDPDFLVEVHLGIRYHKIEEMIYPITNGLKEFSKNSHTFITSAGRLLGETHLRYSIATPSDLKRVKPFIHNFMEDFGWGFLNDLEELSFTEEIFNSFTDYYNNLFYNSYTRAIRGMTLAKLCRPENYESIKETYLEQLIASCYPETYMSRFNSLTLFLDHYSEN